MPYLVRGEFAPPIILCRNIREGEGEGKNWKRTDPPPDLRGGTAGHYLLQPLPRPRPNQQPTDWVSRSPHHFVVYGP